MNICADFKPVPTRAAMALKQKDNGTDFTALVFQEPQATTKTTNSPTPDTDPGRNTTKAQNGKNTDIEFDMKKARNEVLNFAMSNQRTLKNKRKMELFQLVKLGARPPKKDNKNYKELKEERKRLKDNREERKKFHQLGKNQAGAASVKCHSKTQKNHTQKKRAPVANIGQHYGKAQPKLKKPK